MFFYTPVRKLSLAAESSEDSGSSDSRLPQFELNIARLFGAGMLLFGFLLFGLVAYAIKWMEAATLALHLIELITGGLVGLIFGESAALRQKV